eukprot:TRINITY_DN23591_c0_g1_i4.p1 TRINITY_DN23591_c0_g1~~TRINITY_DN23591_c0_g1_i4.p1  ORF type:complete len:619 (+),score=111.01 TRINITY_DN23591_c0_g1_i4:73-1929(+)
MGAAFDRTVRAVTSVACGLLASWELWEQDIWWQLRAGEEILTEKKLQRAESWTYTVRGEPWHNYCWLSCIILHCIEGQARLLGVDLVAALVCTRSALCAAFVYTTTGLASRLAPRAGAPFAVAFAAAVFVVSAGRIQLRPELFVLILCAWSVRRCAELTRRDSADAAAALFPSLCGGMLLTAALHDGLTPFYGAIAGALQLGADCDTLHYPRVCALALLSLCHPYPLQMIEFIIHHLPGIYQQEKVLSNPEHVPLSWALLAEPGPARLALCLWLTVFAAGAPLCYLALPAGSRPVGYRRPGVFLACHAALVAATVDRTRAAPFSALYAAPVLCASGGAFAPAARGPRWAAGALLLAAAAALAADQLLHGSPRGLCISQATLWPVAAVRFVNELPPHMRVQPNLYHTYTAGNYLAYHLRSYLLFGDTRETPYRSLQREYKDAHDSPRGMRHIVEKYNVSSIIMRIPQTARLPGGAWYDVIREWNPPSEWAVVYFDDDTFVAVRRLPAHAELIRAHEYTMLYPALLHDHWIAQQQRAPGDATRKAALQRYRLETRRCDAASSVHCQLGGLGRRGAGRGVTAPPAGRSARAAPSVSKREALSETGAHRLRRSHRPWGGCGR